MKRERRRHHEHNSHSIFVWSGKNKNKMPFANYEELYNDPVLVSYIVLQNFSINFLPRSLKSKEKALKNL